MTSLNATSELVGPAWPVHDHGINILKQKAREAQEAAVEKYASLAGTSTKAMLGEISSNILASTAPNAIYSMDSGNSLKLKLWRAKQKLNPIPQIPKMYEDIMNTPLPENLKMTADNREFLVTNCWTNDMGIESRVVRSFT